MSNERNSVKIQSVIFFVLMWVFYSLNSRYFQVPGAMVLRWGVLAILVFVVIINNEGRVCKPPFLVIAFLIGSIPSIFASVDRTESIIKIFCFIVVIYGSYIYFSTFKSREDFDTAMKIIMVVIIAFEIQSILAIVFGFGYGSGGTRATGITTNANTLGGYSNLAFLSSYYWTERNKGIKKVICFILMLVSVWTVLLSGSRGGFVVLFLMMGTVLLLHFRGGIASLLSIGIIGIALYFLLTGKLSFLNIEAVNRLFDEGGNSRGEIWKVGLNVWKQFPIFGCGYSVSNTYNHLADMEGFDFHNSYITILAEIGIWGVTILGVTILGYFAKGVQIFRQEMYDEKVSLFIICCLMMAAQMIAAYSESFLFAVGSTEACTFWVLLTWNIAYQHYKRHKNMGGWI